MSSRTPSRTSFVAAVVVCLVGGAAHAQALNVVSVGDLPGTGGRWQTGEVVVAAPAAEVQGWFTDASRWAARFPDDEWAKDLGRAPDGRHVAQFKSRVVGRTITVRMREQPGLVVYDGSGKGVTTHGRIQFIALGPERTRIVMQTTGELHGFIGAFATGSMKRSRALGKLRADLGAAVHLANTYAATKRHSG